MIKRRDFITSSLAAVVASQSSLLFAQQPTTKLDIKALKDAKFPKNFLWGVATSAYQIEGAHNVDGKGESIWDRFVLAPGKISNGDTGNIACDSYNRLDEDLALLKELGVKSYRFSISWPRVLPNGEGPLNPKGLDYYRRLADGLVKAGIRPLATLYHWDLPQELEDKGGWPNRDTADHFANYAALMVKELGDKIKHWAMFNEPRASMEMGYLWGLWAPGRKDPKAFFAATHVVNLAQGKAFRAMKAVNPSIQIGTAIDVSPIRPYTDSEADAAAAKRLFAYTDLWYLTPALTGAYPTNVMSPEQMQWMNIQEGDDRLIRAPFDFIGLNNYTQSRAGKGDNPKSLPPFVKSDWGKGVNEQTDIGWDISPNALYDILTQIHAVAGPIPIEITENGAAYKEIIDESGKINDTKRIMYIRFCLAQVARAIKDGVPVRAYHAWSLMDNFEWGSGYDMRFGLVYVDYKTQKRTMKESGKWYAKVIKSNKIL